MANNIGKLARNGQNKGPLVGGWNSSCQLVVQLKLELAGLLASCGHL